MLSTPASQSPVMLGEDWLPVMVRLLMRFAFQ
ncbi:Uncharacterised protein [Mycobacteroides abscessus subsp. abscessus]|nr:Uncharacterised protein [Mycobacteroides abscessus subsp. abscessus]